MYVQAIHFPTYLPETLPATNTIDHHADFLGRHAQKLQETYEDTHVIWKELDPQSEGGEEEEGHAVLSFPDDGEVKAALTNQCQALGDAVNTSLGKIKDALKDFSDAVTTFSPTHSTLKADVQAFNALPAYELTAHEKGEALEAGETLEPTRTYDAWSALTKRLETAQSTYSEHVSTCASAIRESSPAGVPTTKPSDITHMTMVKKAYNMALTWGGRAGDLKNFNGRLTFMWSFDAPTMSRFAGEGVPGWMKVHDQDSWLGGVLPESFKKRIPDVRDLSKFPVGQKLDAKWTSFLDRAQTGGSRAWAATLGALPPGFQDKLMGASRKVREYVHSSWVLDPKTGKYVAASSLVGTKPLGPRATKFMEKLDGLGLDKKVKALKDSKLLKHGGKALGVLDTGATYYNAYTESYNEALRDNPAASPEELRNEAITGAAIEGTAETAGKIAGGVVGRTAGAALGQALIPIPGVGAAVGGFVGGIAGEYIGGKIGKGVGGLINDIRRDGLGETIENVGEKAQETVGKVGDAIGGAAKEAGKGLLKAFTGWG